MPQVAAAVRALDPARTAATLRAGRSVAISIAGAEHELGPEDLLVSMRPLEGYQVEREGSHAVALELELDEDLIAEMRAREIVHHVQSARRQAGLQITDRIELRLDGDPALLAAARAHEPYIAGETLAVRVAYEPLNGTPVLSVDGLTLKVALTRA
jgi:isoleucyl-tRNA synthetase